MKRIDIRKALCCSKEWGRNRKDFSKSLEIERYIDEFSITEDLTEEERKTIKEMNAEAKERTTKENKAWVIWRVRKKAGFYIKKIVLN